MTVQTFARLACALTAAALLSACAGKPQISAQSESSMYRRHAERNYTPPGPASDPWGPYIAEASAKYDVPERWIREVMHQESGGNQYSRGGDLITSGAGAMGLMQVMPATYDEIRGRYPELGSDPFDPHNNILAGTAYIREMYDIYGSPGFLAAYNAGPGRLDDYLTSNRTLPLETRRYVAAIGPRIAGSQPRNASPGEQYAANAATFRLQDSSSYVASNRYSMTPPTPLAPIQLAPQPEPAAGPYIVLRPQPVEVAQLPDPPTETPSPAPMQFAQLPEPPARYSPAPPLPMPPSRSQQQMAAAALTPASPRGSRFALIAPANAEPIGVHRSGYAPGHWAVQVGAFANEGMASAAANAARDHARDVLASAHSSVTPVRQPHGTLYRARLLGLSRDAAAQACEKLARTRTSCMVVSPDAQS